MQLGLQLCSKPFAALPTNTTPCAALNGASSTAAPGAQPSCPVLACAVDCVTSCLAGKGTAGMLPAGSGAEGAAMDTGDVKHEPAAPR